MELERTELGPNSKSHSCSSWLHMFYFSFTRQLAAPAHTHCALDAPAWTNFPPCPSLDGYVLLIFCVSLNVTSRNVSHTSTWVTTSKKGLQTLLKVYSRAVWDLHQLRITVLFLPLPLKYHPLKLGRQGRQEEAKFLETQQTTSSLIALLQSSSWLNPP